MPANDSALLANLIEIIDSKDMSTDRRTHLASCRAALKSAGSELANTFANGADIVDLIHSRASFIDSLVVNVWQRYVNHQFLASLVAVGGYGRGELHPYSDVDLMILIAKEPGTEQTEQLETFLTFLWDIGLAVGHSVRTIDDCADAAKQDVTIATALMESRLLCGSQKHFRVMKEAVAKDKMWPSDKFFDAKRAEQVRRHAKFHDTAHNLEPNVKESPGGLRDIQNITWVAKRHFGTQTLHDLVSTGFLTENEYQELETGQRFLWEVRFALHVLTGRCEDRLLFDYQPRLASRFGYKDAPHSLAVEQFMQRYYRMVMELNRVNEMLLELFEENILLDPHSPATRLGKDFIERNGFLETVSDDTFRNSPSALLKLFIHLQKNPALKGVSAATIRQIRRDRILVDEKFRANPENQRLFMDILSTPNGVTHELRRMNRYGVLGRYLPEFGRVVGRMQFDLFHAYTVDEHTLFVISNLRRFALPRFDREFPYCSEIMQRLDKPVLAYIAGLFHDIAKGRGGEHSTLGATDAENFCRRHELSRYESRLVSWLVRNHLLLSITAQKKDISDPNVIMDFARAVGDQIHLDYLYVLTVADVRATNPVLWNSWKASLFRELYDQARRVLRQGLENPIDKQDLISETKGVALKTLVTDGYSKADIENVWQPFGDEYFLLFTHQELAWHATILLHIDDDSTPTVRVKQQTDRGVTAVFVFAPESGRIFPMVTATLVQLGLNIVDARIVSLGESLTIHTYHVLEDTGMYIDNTERQMQIQEIIQSELARSTSQPMQVTRHVPRQVRMFTTPTNIEIRKDEANQRTVIDIATGDQPGLLSKIGQVFDACEIRLQNARIATVGERVEDVFFVTDRDGLPLNDENRIERLHEKLRTQLEDRTN
ncbi:MAG: [protein-PII] uridylyltransferase [Gammaproteobacteria bacterium]